MKPKEKTNTPTILVIVGITGDLAQRKLLPAIEDLAKAGALPSHFTLLGITRRSEVTVQDVLKKFSPDSYLYTHTQLLQMNLDGGSSYEELKKRLEEIEQKYGSQAQRLFYLSVAPEVSVGIIEHLGVSGLSRIPKTRLLLEKPFGTDLESAKTLIADIEAHFDAEQVYRIDHYVAKEMAQNIIAFRGGNALFKRTWNKDFIEKIEIIASEQIGIEGRAHFYEQTGALRDIIQSHLLAVAALVLMDLPKDLSEVPRKRLAALKGLSVHEPLSKNVLRGQYKTYGDEVKNEKTHTETFSSLILHSDNAQWSTVPIILATGKALKEKKTEIRIYYKKEGEESNMLVLRLQPDEGISFSIYTKRPGYAYVLDPHVLKYHYRDHYAIVPEAYEQVLYNAVQGDHQLFTLNEEVLETWRILNPVQKKWNETSTDLFTYDNTTAIEEILEKYNSL